MFVLEVCQTWLCPELPCTCIIHPSITNYLYQIQIWLKWKNKLVSLMLQSVISNYTFCFENGVIVIMVSVFSSFLSLCVQTNCYSFLCNYLYPSFDIFREAIYIVYVCSIKGDNIMLNWHQYPVIPPCLYIDHNFVWMVSRGIL